MKKTDRIFIAGARGMVGSALVRTLRGAGYHNLLTPSRHELDLTEQASVRAYLRAERPDCVVVAAAKVGGILANQTFPADFLYDNLIIECHLIHEAHQAGVDRLLFLGSTCIYPKLAPQPIAEEALLTGPLEPTNEAYAVAKIAGVKLCASYARQYGRRYIAAMPTNLYGPGDTYHPEHSHVIPALIRRFHEAKEAGAPEVRMWGTGLVRREFLHVDDCARACLFLLERFEGPEHINVGSACEVTIRELAELVAQVIDYKGVILNDPSMPDGTPRKKTDTRRIESLGWAPQIPLREGLEHAYQDFLGQLALSYANSKK